MTTEEKQPELSVEWFDEDPGAAAINRYYRDLGKRLENLRLSLQRRRNDGVFVYNIQIRWPNVKNPQYLSIIKAVTDDGPVVAFNSDGAWFSALLGIESRLRAGKLDWLKDNYPPDNWSEIAAFLHKTTYPFE